MSGKPVRVEAVKAGSIIERVCSAHDLLHLLEEEDIALVDLRAPIFTGLVLLEVVARLRGDEGFGPAGALHEPGPTCMLNSF